MSLLLAVGAVAVAGYLLPAVGNRLRARHDTWPRGWRWLCRIGRHTPKGRYPKARNCLYATRCSSCRRLIARSVVHRYKPTGPKDAKCVQVTVCRRCRDARRVTVHDTYKVVAHHLARLGRLSIPQSFDGCTIIEVCGDCGGQLPTSENMHSPELPDEDHPCAHCGYWVDRSEA
ncbi:hypothetical protein [Micromonospora sp. NBC_01813]|uniref:hypothetical protein n=1 Tax=Micromonospora sp. NBC_01813 TaxID=2975988 RepID=UPI002DD91B8C|nr:hypothetical protein [Micromonospora sp. NBC_01813]WSA07852.1 hypothetical protein OG958_27080 [Micromonospora sp. NBC_01813]